VTHLPVAVIELSPSLPDRQPLTRPISPNVFVFEDTCNVYLLRRGSQAIAIDFGDGEILDELAELGIDRITDVLLTHHHRDQAQGLRRAVESGIRIWAPDAEKDLFREVGAHWQARALDNNYNNRQDRFALLDDVPIDGTLTDYALFQAGDIAMRVVPTPGHTVGSISLLVEIDGQRMAFTGDLLAAAGKVWSLAATQWTYNGAEGVTATIASALDLRDRAPAVLLPSHGDIIEQPAEAIDLLVERLERLMELRREPIVTELRAQPYERVTPHLLRNRTSHSTSYVLLSETGKALLVDYGYDFTRSLAAGTDRASRRPWLYTLDALKRDFGVRAIDVVIPTHYHDDHVAGLNLLRQVEGTQVWAAETFCDVLERPSDYDLPCLWYEPIAVDRHLPTGTTVAWQEYTLTLHEQPGHTRYAVAIELTVDKTRMLFIGDQMGHADGLDLNYVYAGGFAIDDYRKSAELYSRIQPDLLLSGHWQPLHSGLNHLAELVERGKTLEALHRDLLPLDDIDLEAEGPAVEVHPYRIQAIAGQAFQVRAQVRNPHPVVDEMVVKLQAPAGWLVEPGQATLWLARGASGCLAFKVVAPRGVLARRARIGVDLTAGKRRLGQLAEALVDVG
jgi:glyoxylase-like metal-dependent hydrolase (beta-lactamase superfamily II)